MKKELHFSLAEYKERLKKVQEKMVEREVDIFLTHTPENIFYLTGYFTGDLAGTMEQLASMVEATGFGLEDTMKVIEPGVPC